MAALLDGGWRPRPFHEFIVKVHQRCNLACSYCYVYTHADQTWRGRPDVMPAAVFTAFADRLGRHVRAHDLRRVQVVLHGGEPMLLGAAKLGQLAAALRAALPPGCDLRLGLQTNGVLLDEAALRELRRHRITVAVSVDGVAETHDRHRVTHAGRGSFASVRRALELLARPEHRDGFGGLLCTVAPDTDPVACYRSLRAFDPPGIDFLLPHANWGSPPARPGDSPTAYGRWLVGAFDAWHGDPDAVPVRLFESVVDLTLGGASRSEQIGLSPAALVVVESDGAIEQVDALKSAYEGACATGLNVRDDEFDTALTHPGVVARQIGLAALGQECAACPVRRVCGGGHYAHRYRPGAGFRNPSVYCADLRLFVDHVRARVATDVRALAGAVTA
ncbi:FxsB family cyclophane-forming radical SAM/SPASM peptide maturase [Phytohabitans houttuyneae]|uniref:FxsB family cyclophane-forming radical SAM/SPASM peptide maturase n=1 Tax=Phytohabitans houttuyneae TaxID=1076126 RepID=UPI001FE5024E|nr:FxsB family cyclophane-forming radical SAM/SPASM peptide maturase [Phytohabitans houttuyneae]